jgi:glyoxylase-like metal-dependent hydrolase (beta-lactamase superfamily II)
MTTLSRRALLAGTAAATATAAAGLASTPARAAAPMSGKQAPGYFRINVGSYEITAINDGIWLPDLTAATVRNAALQDVQNALADVFAPPGKMPVPITALAVNTGAKLILIDTGSAGLFTNSYTNYLENFAAAGFTPAQVDTVVISHFHGDHINGLRAKDGQLVFPNAEVLVPAPEWAFWMDDAKMNAAPQAMKGAIAKCRRVFGSIADKVARFDPGKEVAPGITSIPAYGHTPGHTAFTIASGNQSLMTLVDVTNIPSLFARYPEWQVVFDVDGNLAVETRKRLYDRAAADKMLTAGYHWPFPAIGHVTKEGGGYRVHTVDRSMPL